VTLQWIVTHVLRPLAQRVEAMDAQLARGGVGHLACATYTQDGPAPTAAALAAPAPAPAGLGTFVTASAIGGWGAAPALAAQQPPQSLAEWQQRGMEVRPFSREGVLWAL
jgi:hypothetical protein